jgi:hypothetical protein
MKKIALIVMFLFVMTWVFSQEDVIHKLQLDSYDLQWQIQGEQILITLKANTVGWISVGFNASRIMKDADIKIGYVDDQGDVFFEDHFGNSMFSHRKDRGGNEAQNFHVIQGSQQDEWTEIQFSMPLNSGDENDQILDLQEPVKIIFAMGYGDNIRAKHFNTDSATIVLQP